MDVRGKNGSNIHIQQKKSYQSDELFFMGFENAVKIRASVINESHN